MIPANMTNFSTTRINRNSAFVMLLVWMFALVSGVANACLLEDPGTPVHQAIGVHTAQDGGEHVSLVGHAHPEAAADQDDDSHTSRQPCLKVCDDSSRSLPKQHTSGQIDPGPPVVVTVLWTAVVPAHLPRHQLDDAQCVISRLPIRVRYSRLAL